MKLLDRVRKQMTEMEYTPDTIYAYTQWMVRYIRFHRLQHPSSLGYLGIDQYITHLSSQQQVAASTQNQALDAITFMVNEVLELDLNLDTLRARTPKRLPETASHQMIIAALEQLTGRDWVMGYLVYGSGLKGKECATLGVDDIDFDNHVISLPDRETILPQNERLRLKLRQQTAVVEA